MADSQIGNFSKEVKHALKFGKPIVALESTVITHGLPQPENLTLARKLQSIIREGGASPATIGILNGKILFGMENEQLEDLAQSNSPRKLSTRDIAGAVVKKESGGTTVAATLRLAEQAGIKVFATGGIGGVHRGSHWDVSADLSELAQRKLVLVCAGAKAILDLPATVEQFETLGVPVVGYKCDQFPAFYSRESGLPVSQRLDTAEEISVFADEHWRLGGRGILLANPIPLEDELPRAEVEGWINQAQNELEDQGIIGGASTPFLLKRLGELSNGKSLRSNLALLENNARLAAQLALHFAN